MTADIKNKTESVNIKTFVSRGDMLINSACLPIDDPDHVYNQIKAQGLKPEDFGIEHPYAERFKNQSRQELIEQIIHLEKELTAFHQYGSYQIKSW